MEPSNRERVLAGNLLLSRREKCLPTAKLPQWRGCPIAPGQSAAIWQNYPEGSRIPWHRVINAQGKISFAVGTERFLSQKEKLQGEQINFSNNRVDLKTYLWQGE